MPSSLAATIAALLGATLLAPGRASDLDVDWAIPADRRPLPPRSGTVGDVVRFAYAPGHNVVLHPSGSCDAADGAYLGGQSPTEYAFAEPGTYTFACDVSGGAHCSLGQIINITITGDAAPSDGSEDGGGKPITGGGGEAPSLSTGKESREEVLARNAAFFNPGEEQGLMEFRMKPYQVPSDVTTYSDFLFNFPEDLGEIVHVVGGEVIVTQPRHLHHFVLSGCTERVDPAVEGLPRDGVPDDCVVPLGGWAAGGDFFGGLALDSGTAFGPALGVRALSLNVHYTDGQDMDPDYPHEGARALATDGIRILYTPDLRPRTVLYKPLIQVGAGPSAMNVPPGDPRHFYTKTCTVEPSCQDTSDERLAEMYQDFSSCGEIKERCNGADGSDTLSLELICPVTCGACAAAAEDSEPAGFEINAVNYHAHLLGREMYTTLLPNKRSAVPVDLESKDLWIYDYQVTYPFLDDNGNATVLRVYPEDKIQATCVYDSTSRDDATRFFLSTYDEMCITQLYVRVDTPAAGDGGAASMLARLNAQSFNCAIDDESAIWGGSLAASEDGRDIWKDHPMLDADCTFPVGDGGIGGLDLIGDSAVNWEVQCSGDSSDTAAGVCDFCLGGLTVPADTVVPGAGTTCGFLIGYAATVGSNQPVCSMLEMAIVVCCPTLIEDSCEFCPEGLTVDANTAVPSPGGQDLTCGAIAGYAGSTSPNDPYCAPIQQASSLCCPVNSLDPRASANDTELTDTAINPTAVTPTGDPEPTDTITAPTVDLDPNTEDAMVSEPGNGASAVAWVKTSFPALCFFLATSCF